MSDNKLNHFVLIRTAIKRQQALKQAQLCAMGACKNKELMV
jgi:hypothetical protein